MSDEPQLISKADLLKQIHVEHALLERILARLTHAQMSIPGVEGVWSVKDVLAHISAWERSMQEYTHSLLQGQPPAVPLPWDVDRMNAGIYARFKDKPLGEVLEEFRQSYWDSIVLIESLSEDQLRHVYPDTWPLGPLWTGIADNMSGHYQEHRLDIQKWFTTQKKVR